MCSITSAFSIIWPIPWATCSGCCQRRRKAPDHGPFEQAASRGRSYRYYRFVESSRENPFAGLAADARWLPVSDLERVLADHGFDRIDVAERRAERNGPRVCIYATLSSEP